jgi:type II secretory pathway pseudopilin PulG
MAWLQVLVGAGPVLGLVAFLVGLRDPLTVLFCSTFPLIEIGLGLTALVVLAVVLESLPWTRRLSWLWLLRYAALGAGAVAGGGVFWLLWKEIGSQGGSTVAVVMMGITALGLAMLLAGRGISTRAQWAGSLQQNVSFVLLLAFGALGLALGAMLATSWDEGWAAIAILGGLIAICVMSVTASLLLMVSGLGTTPHGWDDTRPAAPSSPEAGVGLATVSRALVVGVRLHIISLVALWSIVMIVLAPNLVAAVGRSMQKRTMSTLRVVKTVAQAYAEETGAFPDVDDIQELSDLVVPEYYLAELPTVDAWGWPLEYHAIDGRGHVVRSPGADGRFEVADPTSYEGGPTKTFDGDLVFSTVSGSRWPEGMMPP